MDKIKLVILKQDRYNKVKSGEMTTWLTMDDDFAKSINVDEILRIMNDETSEVCYVRVNGFYIYGNFDEIYKRVDKARLGYSKKDQTNIDRIKKDMFMQCCPEADKKYGVRGIKWEYLPNFKTLDEMDEQEIKAYIKELNKDCKGALKQTATHLDKLDDLLGFLTSLAKHNHELLFDNTDPIKFNHLRFLLLNRIDDMKELVTILEKREKEIDYPQAYEYMDDMIDDDGNLKKKK